MRGGAHALLKDEDVPFAAHVLKYFRPNGDAYLAEMRFLKYHHLCARLSYAASNA